MKDFTFLFVKYFYPGPGKCILVLNYIEIAIFLGALTPAGKVIYKVIYKEDYDSYRLHRGQSMVIT